MLDLNNYGVDIPKEDLYLIAYIDLLGTKRHIKEQDDNTLFNKIYGSFFAASFINHTELFERYNIQIKVFSDNILIAYPINNPNLSKFSQEERIKLAFHSMTFYIKMLSMLLLEFSILFRGAITLNQLVINEIMVWGAGLSEVVDLEEKTAIFPRVILSNSFINELWKPNLDENKFIDEFHLLKDTDGYYYLDYFEYLDPDKTKETICRLTNEIQLKMETEKSQRVLQKYQWYLHYLEIAEIKAEKTKRWLNRRKP